MAKKRHHFWIIDEHPKKKKQDSTSNLAPSGHDSGSTSKDNSQTLDSEIDSQKGIEVITEDLASKGFNFDIIDQGSGETNSGSTSNLAFSTQPHSLDSTSIQTSDFEKKSQEDTQTIRTESALNVYRFSIVIDGENQGSTSNLALDRQDSEIIAPHTQQNSSGSASKSQMQKTVSVINSQKADNTIRSKSTRQRLKFRKLDYYYPEEINETSTSNLTLDKNDDKTNTPQIKQNLGSASINEVLTKKVKSVKSSLPFPEETNGTSTSNFYSSNHGDKNPGLEAQHINSSSTSKIKDYSQIKSNSQIVKQVTVSKLDKSFLKTNQASESKFCSKDTKIQPKCTGSTSKLDSENVPKKSRSGVHKLRAEIAKKGWKFSIASESSEDSDGASTSNNALSRQVQPNQSGSTSIIKGKNDAKKDKIIEDSLTKSNRLIDVASDKDPAITDDEVVEDDEPVEDDASSDDECSDDESSDDDSDGNDEDEEKAEDETKKSQDEDDLSEVQKIPISCEHKGTQCPAKFNFEHKISILTDLYDREKESNSKQKHVIHDMNLKNTKLYEQLINAKDEIIRLKEEIMNEKIKNISKSKNEIVIKSEREDVYLSKDLNS